MDEKDCGYLGDLSVLEALLFQEQLNRPLRIDWNMRAAPFTDPAGPIARLLRISGSADHRS